ncbi:PREDICTED: aspartate aminotransferase isoform X2 [Theobroma cacao]|uniref:Aspartate aminotransferase isoform X2 n=2 Tax=Theobroma cacao TaxID=3641 RepID=A0AB32UQV1_THECC|nr:PREDICTED: aspartate aminotransferase isoform X2 [Theobroma cacao]EOY31369.1 Pyridoxal phosphate-dependent transferases superfamily protein isoform 1 [Theobroma cacao]
MGSYGKLATRVLDTDVPVMVEMPELTKGATDPIPLGKGAVYWQPPEQALEKVKQIAWEPSTSNYGTHEGLPELKDALTKKLCQENKLCNSSVMVTAGSNQGFLNLVLTLCDVTDSVVLFAPYFFNAHMSFRMTGITNILVGPSNPKTLQPDADWLERILSETKPTPKLVSIVNPGNPSGNCIPEPLLKRISDICKKAGSWLVVDNAYEYFIYGSSKHSCVEGNHVINLFSFSKAYGMMGWRVGYIAYPLEAEDLRIQLLKVQDNVAICAPMISQHVALYCLDAGHEWVKNKVKTLAKNKELIMKALSPLGEDAVIGGEGAIYLWVKLPERYLNDYEVVSWLARKYGVVVLPGSACGVNGCIRITYGAVIEEKCDIAAKRLRNGLEELVTYGMVE